MKKCAILLLLFPVWAIGSWADDSLNVRTVGSWPYYATFVVSTTEVNGHRIAAIGFGGGLTLYDVDNAQSPIKLGSIPVSYRTIWDIEIVDNLIYTASLEDGLRIVDISDPSHPQLCGCCLLPGSASHLSVSGGYAYVATASAGLQIVDVSDPMTPTTVGHYDLPEITISVSARDTMAFVSNYMSGGGYYFHVISVSMPLAPIEISSLEQHGGSDIFLRGGYAYLCSNGVIDVIDISDPSNPTPAGSGGLASSRFASLDTLVYSGCQTYGIISINSIADSINPILVDTCLISVEIPIHGIAFVPGYLLSAAEYKGFRIFDMNDPLNLTEVWGSIAPWIENKGAIYQGYGYFGDDGIHVLDCRGPGDPYEVNYIKPSYGWLSEYSVKGTMLAVSEYYYGLHLYDISSPESPAPLDNLALSGISISVDLGDSLVAVASDTGGVHFISISSTDSIYEVGTYHTPVKATRVRLSGSKAYVIDEASGLFVLSVNEPSLPTLLGSFSGDNFRDLLARRDTIFLAASGQGLKILDATNPSDIHLVGSLDTPGNASGVAVLGSTAFIADDTAGLQAIDVSDPANPVFVGHYKKLVDNVFMTPTAAKNLIISSDSIFVSYLYYGLQVYQYYGPSGIEAEPVEQNLVCPFRLAQNVPNPFRQSTKINYQVPKAGRAKLAVYNVTGQVVKILYEGIRKSGQHSLSWDGRDGRGRAVSAGVYFLRLSSPDGQATKKMVVVK